MCVCIYFAGLRLVQYDRGIDIYLLLDTGAYSTCTYDILVGYRIYIDGGMRLGFYRLRAVFV